MTRGALALGRADVAELHIARLHVGELTVDRPLRGAGAPPAAD